MLAMLAEFAVLHLAMLHLAMTIVAHAHAHAHAMSATIVGGSMSSVCQMGGTVGSCCSCSTTC